MTLTRIDLKGAILKTTSRQILWITIICSVLMMVTAIVYLKLEGFGSLSVEEKQNELKSLIQGYIADGILLKVEQDASLPRIYVTPEFGVLTSSEKQVILKVVLDYFQLENEEIHSINLFDSQIEHPIGHFDGKALFMN